MRNIFCPSHFEWQGVDEQRLVHTDTDTITETWRPAAQNCPHRAKDGEDLSNPKAENKQIDGVLSSGLITLTQELVEVSLSQPPPDEGHCKQNITWGYGLTVIRIKKETTQTASLHATDPPLQNRLCWITLGWADTCVSAQLKCAPYH